MLVYVVESILYEINWILAFDFSTKIEEDDHEHIRIIDALRNKDSEQAMYAMKDHLEKTKSRIQSNLPRSFAGVIT